MRDYAEGHDDLAGDATSHLSAHLHFGSLSATELLHVIGTDSPAARAFVRQVAWRDFNHQVLAARPEAAHRDYRPRQTEWRHAPGELWRTGRTGYPIVDAGMRQLLRDGWMHNRARLIAGSFLTKTLLIDWRLGAQHFLAHLVDADIANNQLNWQWVAGTGTDSRPYRVLNPLRQAEQHDPASDYVRKYVPELAHLPAPVIHRPWNLPPGERARLDYPEPMADLSAGRARFLARTPDRDIAAGIGPSGVGYPPWMTTYTHTAEADIAADALFSFLAEPRNLPRYFPQMTAAEPKGGETVHVEAQVHGHEVDGDAWVHPNLAERRLEWGAEGPDDYHGELQVEEVAPGRSRITVSLHSVRDAQGTEVQEGLEQTVAALTQAAAADDQAEMHRQQGEPTT